MNKKPLKRKDSLEKVHEDRIISLQKQSKYLESLLTAALPKYYGGKSTHDSSVPESVIQAKRLFFADSPQKATFKKTVNTPKQNDSPLKLKKISPTKSQSHTPKAILKPPTLKKNEQKSAIKPQEGKNSENEKQLHPYSILIQLEKNQQKIPQSQKIMYQYREIHDLKEYPESQIDTMIEELLNKCKMPEGKQKLSVTDQFILSRFFDLKVRKALQRKKQQSEESKSKKSRAPIKSNLNLADGQLIKAFEEIKFVWQFYELKLQHCPDLLKGNSKDEHIYLSVKNLYLELITLEDMIRYSKNQQEDEASMKFKEDKKKNKCHPKKMTEDVIAKKIKAAMKKFKDIMVYN